MNSRHLNALFAAKINWPNMTDVGELLPLVILRIPSHYIFLYDTMDITVFFKRRSGKIFEGKYMMVADHVKGSWYCVEFHVNEAEQKYQTGWHAQTEYPNFGNVADLVSYNIADYITAENLGVDDKSRNYGLRRRNTIGGLKVALQKAEAAEDYEKCIEIRDEINKLKPANQ